MKKLLAILLILVVLVSAVSSCRSNTGNDITNDPPASDNTQGGGDNSGSDNSGNGNGDNSDVGGGNQQNYCATKAEHTDADKNGLCDKCDYDVVVTLDIYALNDLHGKVFDTDQQIGIDELSTYLRGASTRDEAHIFLSSGDMWQGSAESNITNGALVTDWMSELGFVSMTLGNHEYDWGEEAIRKNAEIANFPLLAINVYSKATNARVEYCSPSVVVERGDLKIGIIGAIGDCYSSISSDKVENVYFKVGSELRDLVIAESNRLRNEEKVDIVVYSLHDGYGKSTSGDISTNSLSSYYSRELSANGYVDVVFEGHTHQKYVLVDTYGVYHLQNGGDNKSGISHIELDVNFVTDDTSVNSARIVSTSEYSSLEDDPIIEALHEKYAHLIDDSFDVLGYNSAYRNSNFIEDLTAKLYYQLGVETWGDEYDIVLGGGFLQARSPYSLQKGEVTYSDLMMIMPFDNQIVLCSIKGSDLKRKFFETSNSDYHIYYEEYGQSVRNSIDSNKTYYVVVDSYTSQYKYNNLTVVKTYDETTFARDLIAAYVSKGGLE